MLISVKGLAELLVDVTDAQGQPVSGAQVLAVRPSIRSERFVGWLSRHWLLVFNVSWGAFVIAPWLAPVFMRIGATGIGNADFGWKVAYSDRMVAMYTTFWFAAMAFAFIRRHVPPLPIWGYILLIFPMALDGGTHLISDVMARQDFGMGFRDTNVWLAQLTRQTFPVSFYAGDALGSFNSWMRLLTGALFGIASVWLAFPYAEATFNQIREALEDKFKRLERSLK